MLSRKSEQMAARDIPILTSRLLLREPELGDASALQDIVSDPRVALTTSSIPHPYPEDGAKRFIEHVQKTSTTDARNLAVTLREGGDLIGMVGFSKAGNEAELAYMISPGLWGRGYATEAAQGVIDYIFHRTSHSAVIARAMAMNTSSQAVLRKLGFRQEGQEDAELSLRGGTFSITFWRLNRAVR